MAKKDQAKPRKGRVDVLPTLFGPGELDLAAMQEAYPSAIEYYLSGVALQHPDGGDESPEDAVYHYKLAADLGHAGAQRAMGFCCERGYGCERDDAVGALWLGLAAKGGDAEAQYWSATKLLASDNRTQVEEAVRLLESASDKGHRAALHRLGLCFLGAEGIERDEVRAFEYFHSAAEMGFSRAEYKLVSLYSEGIGVEADDEQAASWCLSAAKKGHRGAQYSLGCFYEDGRGIERSLDLAIHWYSKSSMQGFALANQRLSICHEEGIGVEKDERVAFAYCRVAANQGLPWSVYRLGRMYFDGSGTQEDRKEACVWLQRAAELGVGDAQFFLADRVIIDPAERLRLYHEAARNDHGGAMFKLGRAYADGTLCNQDGEKALRFLMAAHERGRAGRANLNTG